MENKYFYKNILQSLKKNKLNIIYILIFLILPWFFFNDSIKVGSVLFGRGDPNTNTLPLWDLLVTSIKNGEFPFWNRYIFSGFPFFSNPQTSMLYPVLWFLYFIFSLPVAYNISIMLHYSLAGIFTYLFLNRYKLDKLASFAGGMIFMFSGMMIVHKGHAQMLYAAVWFPLILYFIDKFKDSKRYEFILAGSIFYAFAFFAGHTQIFFYGSLVVLLYIIYYFFINIRKSYYFLLSLTIFIITGLLVCVQLFSIYELSSLSIRREIDYGSFVFFSYSLKMIPTLLSPFIYGGGPSGVQFFGDLAYMEIVAYFGIAAIVFAILGIFAKNKDKYFWIFVLVFSFILVLGMNTPVYRFMFEIPLYNKFRIPTRNWFEFGLAFSVLSAFGFDYFIKNYSKKIKAIIIVILTFLVSIGIMLGFSNIILKKINNLSMVSSVRFLRENFEFLLKTTEFKNYAIYFPIILILLTVFLFIIYFFKRNKFVYILFIILIFFDLRSFGNYMEGNSDVSYINEDIKKYEEFSFMNYEDKPYRIYPGFMWWYAEDTLWPNKNIHHKVDLVTGYDPLILRDYNNFTDVVFMDRPENIEKLLKNNNVLSMLNLKYVLYYSQEDFDDFNNRIKKLFYEDNGSVIDHQSVNDAELRNVALQSDGHFLFDHDSENLKYIKIPVEINENQDYLVSFEIRENLIGEDKSLIDREIFVDFFGEGYDDPEQEFFLKPGGISTEYKNISRTICSGDVPADKEIFFRIFTYSAGQIEIKNIGLNKVKIYEYNDYSDIYNKHILVLKNNDYLPRFYFNEKIRNVSSAEEAHKIIWETDNKWIENRFDPHSETLVENNDFDVIKFDSENSRVDIIEYTNNMVKLDVLLESDNFLVFADSYYPGWRAFIDGSETDIYRTNGLVKGIFVPSGEHIIEFKYLPTNFWIYFSISTATFLSILIALFLLYKKRKS